MDGKVHVFKRSRSSFWQCETFLEGRKRSSTTKEANLQRAEQFAEEWYLELRGKHIRGEIRDTTPSKQVLPIRAVEDHHVDRPGVEVR